MGAKNIDLNLLFGILYLGVILVPVITQSVLIPRLPRTDESIELCNLILIWFTLGESTLILIGTIRMPMDYKQNLTFCSRCKDPQKAIYDSAGQNYFTDSKFFLSFDHVLLSVSLWLLSSIVILIVWKSDHIIWVLVFSPLYVFLVTFIVSWHIYIIVFP